MHSVRRGPITVDEVGVLLYQISQFLKTCSQRIGFAAFLFGLALLPWPVTTARVLRHKPAVIILCPSSPTPQRLAHPLQQGLQARPYSLREAIDLFHYDLVVKRPDLMPRLPELRGKTLACWCKPGPCHGDAIAQLADRTG